MRIMSGMSHKGLKLYMYYDEEIHFAFSLLVAVLINTISNVITSRIIYTEKRRKEETGYPQLFILLQRSPPLGNYLVFRGLFQ